MSHLSQIFKFFLSLSYLPDTKGSDDDELCDDGRLCDDGYSVAI